MIMVGVARWLVAKPKPAGRQDLFTPPQHTSQCV